jgi:hypothetical protein
VCRVLTGKQNEKDNQDNLNISGRIIMDCILEE